MPAACRLPLAACRLPSAASPAATLGRHARRLPPAASRPAPPCRPGPCLPPAACCLPALPLAISFLCSVFCVTCFTVQHHVLSRGGGLGLDIYILSRGHKKSLLD